MAITRGFFNSINGDRKYNAEDIGNYFEGLISNGIYQTVGDRFVCLAGGTGLTVNVGTGKAMINSHWIKSDSIIPLTISPADVQYTRYDAIVICLDKSEGIRSIEIYVKKGTPSVDPSVPALIRTEYVHELLLATVKVTANAAIIKQSDITDMRLDTNSCGFITGLVEQVDTSDLFHQYEAMFNEYYRKWTANFESWFKTLTSELKVNTSLNKEEATLIMGTSTKNIITDKIEYNEGDILFVYVDGILFVESVDYEITNTRRPLKLSFNSTLSSGTTIYILCIKSVIGNSGSGSSGGSSGNEGATTCEHTYTSTITKQPTCTEAGVITYTCSKCGDSYTESIEATGHNYVAENTKEPTCTEPGIRTTTCSKCGNSYTNDMPATGHTYGAAEVVEPTCTEQGYTKETCLICGYVNKKNYTAETGHMDENNDGKCDNCGATVGDFYTITVQTNSASHGTVSGGGSYEKNSTAIITATPKPGYKFKFWVDDVDEEIPANPLQINVYRDYFLTAVFEAETTTCEHTYTSTITKQPTCTEAGVITYTCSKCGDSYTEAIEATGHNYVTENTKEPTCTETGIRTTTCSKCGNSYTNDMPATGHTYGAVEVVEPTCTEQGYTKETCLICGYVNKKNYTAATGHESGAFDFRSENVVEPTCTEDGSFTKIKVCNKCGAEISRSTVTIDATGHMDENLDGKCDNCGATVGSSGDTVVNGVLYIGTETTDLESMDAYYDRTDITSVIIPSGIGVSKIGQGAFSCCTNLKSAKIPTDITLIENSAFYNTDITDVYYGGNKEDWEMITIEDSNDFTKATIHCTDGDITYVAFTYDVSPTGAGSVQCSPSGIELYYGGGKATFVKESTVKLIAIPASGYVFKHWISNGEVVSTNSAQSFLANVNSTFTAVFEAAPTYAADTIVGTTLYIGTNTTTIGTTYRGNDQITRVVIPDSVTEIGTEAFSMCENLKEVTIGKNVQTIGQSAFMGCMYMEGIDIPNSVTSIGEEAFYACNGLNTVIIGTGLTNIGNYAFAACFNISNVKYRGNVNGWNAITKGTGNEYLTNNTVKYI